MDELPPNYLGDPHPDLDPEDLGGGVRKNNSESTNDKGSGAGGRFD